MTVNRTTLLDLPLPVTGTESGTWGDTTNNGLSQYMDIAIAGMNSLTSANFTAGALTIANTLGDSSATNIAAGSAQYATIRVSSLAVNSTITAPGSNRSYRIINADATYSLTIKASGQTGVTFLPGQTGVVAFNGTDYVIVGVVGAGTATDNAVARFDGTTGEIIQNSGVTIDDSNNVSGVAQLNITTLDATNIEVTNIKAKDGTAAGSIADSTGVVTLGSSVLTTTDINGGTIDGTAIGGSIAAAGAFTTLSSTGNTTLGDASGDTLTINGTAVSVPNNLNFDSNTLFIDAANNRVGVGTANPSKLFFATSAPDTSGETNGGMFFIAAPGLTSAQANSISTGMGSVSLASNNAGDLHLRSFWGSVIETGAGGVTGGATNSVVAENAFAVRQYNTGTSSFNNNFVMYTTTGAAVFNEDGLDRDFRVESDNNSYMLWVDASADGVNIGGSDTIQGQLNVIKNTGDLVASTTALYITTGQTYGNGANKKNLDLVFQGYRDGAGTGNGAKARIRAIEQTGDSRLGLLQISTLDTSGNLQNNIALSATEVVVNDDSVDMDFRVESDGNTHMLFVDGGGNWVSVGGNTRGYNADLTVDGFNGIISIYDANGGIYFGTGAGGFGTNGAIARASTAGFHIASSAVGDLCIAAEVNTLIRFGTSTSGTPSTRMTIAANGDVNVVGALSKGSGSFRIDHPLPSKKDTHQLVHSFVEAPQADLIYRGKAQLVSGRAVVNIDRAAGMTEGTFVVLCRDVQCFTSNEQDWDAVRGSVTGNILTIECQNPASTAVVFWMVIGERQDPHMYETDWTDENGKVIVEPLKPSAAIS